MGNYKYDERTGDFIINKGPKLNELRFSKIEMLSIVQACVLAIGVNGYISNVKMQTLKGELFQLCGFNSDLMETILKDCLSITIEDLIVNLVNLNENQKCYVVALVIVVMFAERNITDEETKFFSMLTYTCKFPNLTIADAFELMSNL